MNENPAFGSCDNGRFLPGRCCLNAAIRVRRFLQSTVVCIPFLAAAMVFGQTGSGTNTTVPTTDSPGVASQEAESDAVTADDTTEPASAIPTSPREIVEALRYPFAIAFGLASVIAVWCAIERLVMLRRSRVIPKAFVERFLMQLRSGRLTRIQAEELCHENGSPVAEVFLHGIRKWGKPSVEIEQAVIDGGERQVSLLRKRLRVLNGVATLTPLIGLLGTVIGMIQAFNDIAESDAMGQAQELAQGIALALLTTAVGLFIAIPSLAAYMFLAGKVDSLVVQMDRYGQEVVHLISAESLAERGQSAARRSQGQSAENETRRAAPQKAKS